MARTVHKLTDTIVRKLNERGLYADGDGLYLQVAHNGSKSWVYRFSLNGRAREMGLGPLRRVTLSEARALAADARLQRDRGVDPIEAGKSEIAAAAPPPAPSTGPLFRDFAEEFIDGRQGDWKSKNAGGVEIECFGRCRHRGS